MKKSSGAAAKGPSVGRTVVFAEMVRGTSSSKIIASNDAGRCVLAEGSFLSEKFANLQVEAGCSRELVDAVTTATVKPRVILTIVLNGEVHFAYDDSEHVLKVNPVRQSRNSTAQAVAVNIRRLTVFRRHIRRGERSLSKVQLMFSPDWLQRGEPTDPLRRKLAAHLLDRHLASLAWQPDEATLELCRELLELRNEPDRLRRSLRAEGLAHQVLWAFVRHVDSLPLPETAESKVPPRALEPTARAIAWMEANLDQELSVEEVARASAMSVSALQRRFRRDTGMTVFEYLRGRRLDKVRDALRRGEVTVSEAAYLAGYNHTSNFITAFRRRHGSTPGELDVNDSRSL
ncbi:helix-turn-helix transcriptional regulator [Halopseudomonas sabulinigri]|uniref:AraC family transcriptional regulator n=1 Tax=Halopseudomonas sabulinigri TaxID=472181 RepID=A0ABP9ZQF7_9GAMM